MSHKRISHRFDLENYSEAQMLLELFMNNGDSKKNIISKALTALFVQARETKNLETFLGIAIAEEFKNGLDLENVYSKYILQRPAEEDDDEYNGRSRPEIDILDAEAF